MRTLVYTDKVKHCFEKQTEILATQSLVLSVLSYRITVWRTKNNTFLTRTQKLQNFAINVADGKAQKFVHVAPIFKELEWLNIRKTFIFNTTVTIFKQLHNYYPEQMVIFPTVTDINGTRTRQSNHLYVLHVSM